MTPLYGRSLLKKTGATYAGGWTMPDALAGLKNARNLRDQIAGRYDEAISYALPGRVGIKSGPDQSQIYDDTAVIATPEFASRIQQGVIPNFSQWASYVPGIIVEGEQKDQLARELAKIDRYRFEIINSSNFALEANECFLDLALGTFAMEIEKGVGSNPLNVRALALASICFGVGPDGRPDPIYKESKLTLNAIKVRYPEARTPADLFKSDNPDCEYVVVEAWHRDWSRPAENRYRRSIMLENAPDAPLLTEWHHGDGCCPILIARWSKAAAEGWGRGPLFNLLPSLRKVNYAERALLDHTEIALAGIWTLEDDGIVNPDTVRLDPGTMVPVAMGSAGLKNVAPSGSFDVGQFVLEEARANIRKALYTEQLGNPNKTPMSATEVTQRMAELARAVGSPFARIIVEFVLPAIVRIDRILKDRGLIKMPEVDGKKIKLISTSSLAQSQRFEIVESLDRWAGLLQARLGPEMANIVIDSAVYSDELATNLGVPRGAMRPPAQQAEIVQALTAQASAAQSPAPGGVDGGAAGPGAGA